MTALSDSVGKQAAAQLALNPERACHLLEIFLREELHRTGLTEVVIGLSGGVDSALSTYLAARALGAEHVHVVLMPYRTSNPASREDAMRVVRALELPHEVFDITGPVDSFISGSNLGEDARRRGNVMARMRMITLFDRSQALGGLVVGTSNKTESLLGYTTLFGDNASAINPLGDLYKTQVWQLSRYVGVPKEIVEKAPSADLWEGQTDEAELGCTFAELDLLLYCMVDQREADAALVSLGFAEEFVRKIRRRIQAMQFKRRPPVIAKVGNRTINVDYRYARDWGT